MESYGTRPWGMNRYLSSSSLKQTPLAPRITPQDVYHDQEIPDFQLDDIEMIEAGASSPYVTYGYSSSPTGSLSIYGTPPSGNVSKRSSLSSLKFSASLAHVTTTLASALHLSPPKPPKMVRFSDEVAIIPGTAAQYYEEEEDYVYAGQETCLDSERAEEEEEERYTYRHHTSHHSHSHSHSHQNDARLSAAREEQRRKASIPRSSAASKTTHRGGIWGQYGWDKWSKSSISLPMPRQLDFSGFFKSRSSTPAPQKPKAPRVRPTLAPIQTAPIPTGRREIPIPTTPYYASPPPSTFGTLSRRSSIQDWDRPDLLTYSTSPPLPTFEDLNNYSHHNQRNHKLHRQGSTYLPGGGFNSVSSMRPTSYVDCQTVFGY